MDIELLERLNPKFKKQTYTIQEILQGLQVVAEYQDYFTKSKNKIVSDEMLLEVFIDVIKRHRDGVKITMGREAKTFMETMGAKQ